MTRSGAKKNLAASVHQRLLQRSRDRRENFNLVLDRYAMERLLYRLARSEHGRTFVLKGAALFTVWLGHPHRATKDIDLLGSGEPDIARLTAMFNDVCAVEVEDDGIVFDAASVNASRIKEDADYEGVRVLVRAKLGNAVLQVQVDVGFGDVITPHATAVDFPTLLDSPPPRLRVYPRETVVAEKLEAMVKLGIANSRMKDFFDLDYLASGFEFDGPLLVRAIRATFQRRGTAVPDNDPVAFTQEFVDDVQKRAQWTAFLKRSGVGDATLTLDVVTAHIRAFLVEPLRAIRDEVDFTNNWANGAWRSMAASRIG
jgi:predicted nucleotidyltransferase component of viral defense system